MGRIVLDSTVLIDALRGLPAVQRLQGLYEQGDMLLTTAINLEEITRGLRPKEQHAVDALVDGLGVLPIRSADGARAGRWRREFAARGVALHQADCLIAAAAAGLGARLATGNVKDFPMRELTVEEWLVGR